MSDTDILNRVQILLDANTAQFEQKMKDAQKTSVSTFDKITSSAKVMAIAVASGTLTATTAMGTMALQTANSAVELERYSLRANTTTQDFQKMAVGAAAYGIEQEELSGQMKDFNEKLGELTTIGAGGGIDFFEQIAMKTEGSAEAAKKLVLEMQRLSGPEALQMYVDKLEEAGVTQQQMSFYLESMASDMTDLIPLLVNGGEGMELYGQAAERAGLIMDKETIAKAKILKEQIYLLDLQMQGAKNQLMQAVIPAFVDIAEAFFSGSEQGLQFTDVADLIGDGLRLVAKVAIGAATSVQLLGKTIGGLSAAAVALGSGELRQARDIASMMIDDLSSTALSAAERMDTLSDSTASSTAARLSQLREVNTLQDGVTAGLDELVKKKNEEAEADKKAAEAAKLKYQYTQQELVMLQRVAEISSKHNFNEIGAKYGLPEHMLAGVVAQESGGNYRAKSATKAIGLFQTTSIYREEMGLTVNDSYNNIEKTAEAAAKYISKAYKELGSWEAALTAYNAGIAGTRQLLESGYTGSAAKTKEAKEYAGKVDKWMSALNNGQSIIGKENATKGLQDYQKYLEQQERLEKERLDLRNKYAVEFADDDWKRRIDYNNQVAELNFAFHGEELQQYLAVANTRYAEAQKLADMQFAWEVTEHRLTEEQKLRYSYNIQQQEIQSAAQLTTEQRGQKLKALQEQFNQEFAMFKLAQEKQLLEMNRNWMTAGEYASQYYALVRQEILNTPSYSPEMKHGLVKEANFNQGMEENSEREGIWGDYQSRFSSDTNEYQLDHDLLKQALDQKLITEQEYFNKRAVLHAEWGQNYFAGTADVLRSVLGEESGFYQAAFAMQKAYAVAKVALNAPETYSNVYATVSALPVVGPYLAPVMAGAAVALQMAQAATLGSVTLSGMAHDGIDNVPKEGTWLLDKGERVVDSRTNADLKSYLQDARSQSSSPNITINVPPGYTAHQTESNDGITIDVVDRMTAQNLADPNSQTSKAYRRQYATSWR